MSEGTRYRVLVTDEVDPEGTAALRAHPAIEVVERPTRPLAEVLEEIASFDAFIGRSATRVSRELLQRGDRLKVVGRAGVGVDNIDLKTATELGIAVINAPGGNTVSVAELVFGVMLSLARHIHQAQGSMREGRWDRSRLGGSFGGVPILAPQDVPEGGQVFLGLSPLVARAVKRRLDASGAGRGWHLPPQLAGVA